MKLKLVLSIETMEDDIHIGDISIEQAPEVVAFLKEAVVEDAEGNVYEADWHGIDISPTGTPVLYVHYDQ